MIPKKLYVRKLDIDIFDEEVNATRAWVANRPNTGRREYTDLSQVWHPAEEEPETSRQVVAINEKGILFSGVYRPYDAKGYTPIYPGVYWNGGGCMNGARLLDWQEAIKWAYIEDLLPKGARNDRTQG